MPSRPRAFSLEEAAQLAASLINPPFPQWVPLDDALGRILAHDLEAPFAIPGEARSRMDGYAVRAADTVGASPASPRELRLVQHPTLTAGTVPQLGAEPGTAGRILTGALLPHGADAVLPDEEATQLGETLQISRPVSPGHWVAPPGEQIHKGEIAVRAGSLLTPGRIAAAAALPAFLALSEDFTADGSFAPASATAATAASAPAASSSDTRG